MMIRTAIHGDWVVEGESGVADGNQVVSSVFDVDPIKTLGKVWIKVKTHHYEQPLSFYASLETPVWYLFYQILRRED